MDLIESMLNSTGKPLKEAAGAAFKAVGFTGGLLTTMLRKAMSNMEVRKICRSAEQANFENRMVAAAAGLDKRQLGLINETNDDDVYDYKLNMTALDFISGGNDYDYPGSEIVSGGSAKERSRALIPFIIKACNAGMPIIALHSGDAELENIMSSVIKTECVFIGGASCFKYDIFHGMSVNDIASLLYETAKQDDNSTGSKLEALLNAVIMTLIHQGSEISVNNLASLPFGDIPDILDKLLNNNIINNKEYAEVSSYYLAGSSENNALRIFLNKLSRQFDNVGWSGANGVNIKRLINHKGAAAVNIGAGFNNTAVSLLIKHLLLLQARGFPFAVILDEFPIALFPDISELLRNNIYALLSSDLISSLSSRRVINGTGRSDDLLSELTGNVRTAVLFRHSSGASCQKWSDYIGKYRKFKIEKSISQRRAFIHFSADNAYSVRESDEPRVRPETLTRLPVNIACIRTPEAVLIINI